MQTPKQRRDPIEIKKFVVPKPKIDDEVFNSEGRLLSSIKHLAEVDLKIDSFDHAAHPDKISSFKKSKLTIDDIEDSQGLMLNVQPVRLVSSHVRVVSLDKDLEDLRPSNQQVESFLGKREPQT